MIGIIFGVFASFSVGIVFGAIVMRQYNIISKRHSGFNLLISLYEVIKHGDEEHQTWLKREIIKFHQNTDYDKI